MLLDPTYKSYTKKVLEAIGLGEDYRERYRTEYGTLVLEHIKSKTEIEIFESQIDEIKRNRGALQKFLLDRLKSVILSYETSDSNKKN